MLPLTVAVQDPSGLTFASSRPLSSEPEPEPLLAEAEESAAPLLESEPLELSAVDSVLSLSADALESAAPEELALLDAEDDAEALELALEDAEELALLLLELLEADPPPQALSASTPAKARESRAGAFCISSRDLSVVYIGVCPHPRRLSQHMLSQHRGRACH